MVYKNDSQNARAIQLYSVPLEKVIDKLDMT